MNELMKKIRCVKKCLKDRSIKQKKIFEIEKEKVDNETKVLNILKYTTTDQKSYNAAGYEAGYHTVKLKCVVYKGQRNIETRFENIEYDFTGKNVLDIGCNQGGMLMHIQNQINKGYGIDYNYKLINAANKLKEYNHYDNLSFYLFDLEREDINFIKNFYAETLDIIFLLSVCMWIKNWKDLIEFTSYSAKDLLFETNGSPEQQKEQIEVLYQKYKTVKIIDNFSRDDYQPNRQLILCSN